MVSTFGGKEIGVQGNGTLRGVVVNSDAGLLSNADAMLAVPLAVDDESASPWFLPVTATYGRNGEIEEQAALGRLITIDESMWTEVCGEVTGADVGRLKEGVMAMVGGTLPAATKDEMARHDLLSASEAITPGKPHTSIRRGTLFWARLPRYYENVVEDNPRLLLALTNPLGGYVVALAVFGRPADHAMKSVTFMANNGRAHCINNTPIHIDITSRPYSLKSSDPIQQQLTGELWKQLAADLVDIVGTKIDPAVYQQRLHRWIGNGDQWPVLGDVQPQPVRGNRPPHRASQQSPSSAK